MDVFASWSGELSHKVAKLLKEWIEDVLQGTNVWLSSQDIEKGSVWFSDISINLKDTAFGILCVDKTNLDAPWILFEAGALSKGLNSNRVSPLLIDIVASDLRPPLSFLNATLPNEDDMFKLIRDINENSGESQLPAERLERAFRRCWPEFQSKFEGILKTDSSSTPVPRKTDREILDELAEISKSIFRAFQDGALVDKDTERYRMHHEIELRKRVAEAEERVREMQMHYDRMMKERLEVESHLREMVNQIKDSSSKS